VYEGRRDGLVHPQDTEVERLVWVSPSELDRMLRELTFCPNSREVFARLRGR